MGTRTARSDRSDGASAKAEGGRCRSTGSASGATEPSTSAIGRSIPRIDGRPKVTGRARFGADIGTRGLLHARPVLALPAHAPIDRIDRAAALAVPGVVAVLTAADLPIAAAGNERIHEPLARYEILWAGQPVALVVAETAEAAADAAALVVVDTSPLEAVVDIDRAVAPGAAKARLERLPEAVGGLRGVAARGGRGRRRGVHAGRAGVGQRRPSERLPARRRHRRAGRERRHRGGPLHDELGPPGLHRTAGRDGRVRRRRRPARHERHAGHVPHAFRIGPTVRAADRRGSSHRRAHRRRVRRQVDDRGSAGRRRRHRAGPAGPARADSPRGHADDQPGAGGDAGRPDRGRRGRPAPGPLGAPPVRDRRLRREQHRGDRRDPHRRAVSLGSPRSHRLRGRDQSGRDRRLSSAGRTPGDLRPRAARRRARRPARPGSDRAPTPEPRRPGRRDGRRHTMGRDRPVRVPRPRSPRIRSIATGRRSPRTRASASPSGPGRAAGSRPPRSAAWSADGSVTRRHRCGRPVGDDDGVRHDRGGRAGHHGRSDLGRDRRHGIGASLAGDRRQRHHLFDGRRRPTGDRGAPRQDHGLCRPHARDRRRRPRARRRRRPAERDARSRPDPGADRGVTRRLHVRVRTARGPRRDGPVRSSRRSRSPTSSASASTARPARSSSSSTSSPRTSGGRSTRPSSKGSSTAARPRASAGRSTRRWSTTSAASC